MAMQIALGNINIEPTRLLALPMDDINPGFVSRALKPYSSGSPQIAFASRRKTRAKDPQVQQLNISLVSFLFVSSVYN